MSTVRLLVLGSIIRSGMSHGYGVYSDITSWRAENWTNVKPGSIYHALRKLESQGMINAVNSDNNVKLGPSRTEYSITTQGTTEFEVLLESVLISNDIQMFAAGISFMEMLPREKVIACLTERYSTLKESAKFLKNFPTKEFAHSPSNHPELVGLWISYVENEATTTQRVLENLQKGKYAFKNEIAKVDTNE